jgi:type II secretory pathway pseudopilin PulG
MRSNGQAGFSLLEVLLCVAVIIIVSLAAVPNMMTAIANIRLRSSMTSLAGVIQNTRVLAVKHNRHMTTRFETQPYGILAYVKRTTDTSALQTSDAQVELEAPVTKVTAPSGFGAPPALDTDILGFTPETGDPSFSPMGLPCAFSTATNTCPGRGFAYYFHDSRTGGAVGWAALSVSPAGRMKKWYWNGSAWTD